MIHVVLDTTVYHRDPKRTKAPFQALARLSDAREITLHIPDVVRREFISQQQDVRRKGFEKLANDLQSMRRHTLPAAASVFLDKSAKKAKELATSVQRFVQKEFDDWAKAMSAKIHPVAKIHGRRVVDAYFARTPPFREAKFRDDFPDAFIWQVVADLVESVKKVYFVSDDSRMFQTAQGTSGVEAFNSLEEFIQSKVCEDALQGRFTAKNLKVFIDVLGKHPAVVVKSNETVPFWN